MVEPVIRGSYITVLWKCRSLVLLDGDMKEDEALATMPMANLPWARPAWRLPMIPFRLSRPQLCRLAMASQPRLGQAVSLHAARCHAVCAVRQS